MLFGGLALHWESTVLATLHPLPLSLILVRIGVAVSVLAALWAWKSRLAGKPALSRVPRWVSDSLVAAVTCLLFMSPIFYSWTSPGPNKFVVSTLMPYSDADSFFRGAERALEQGDLDPFNCRRPTNSLLLATRLGITGGDLRLAILLQAALLGLAVTLLARTVAPDLGRAAAVLLTMVLFVASCRYVPLLLSETTGVTLGALATAILWSGARARSLPVVLLGIFAMTFAQNARIGTIFVLPALVLWVLFKFKGKTGRVGLAAAGWACAVIVAGLLLDTSLRAGYGCGFGVGHGNFSHTLYGFSTGSPDWQKALQDLPEVSGSAEAELNRRIYAEAWSNIRRDPWRFVEGLWAGAGIAMRTALAFIRFNLAVSGSSLANGLVFLFLVIGTLRFAWRTRRSHTMSLVACCLLGVLVSMPIIMPDGGPRTLAPAFPLLFLPLCAANVGWRPRFDPIWQRFSRARPADAAPGILVVAVLVVLAAFGPAVFHLVRARSAVPAGRQDEPGTLLVRLGPASVHLTVLARRDPRPTFAPRIRHQEFAEYVAQPSSPPGLAEGVRSWLGDPFLIILTLQGWIIGPTDLLADRPRLLRLRGQRGSQPYFRFFAVDSYEELAVAE